MECPQDMTDISKDDCITSNKCIYGLVQAAKQYYKNAFEISNKWGFVGGNVNQSLYVQKSEKGLV